MLVIGVGNFNLLNEVHRLMHSEYYTGPFSFDFVYKYI